MTNYQRLTAIAVGRVQGVGFRANVQAWAIRHQIVGWVRNQRDGTVQVVAESPHSILAEFLAYLKSDPPDSSVVEVDVTWSAATGEFEKFQIRRF